MLTDCISRLHMCKVWCLDKSHVGSCWLVAQGWLCTVSSEADDGVWALPPCTSLVVHVGSEPDTAM